MRDWNWHRLKGLSQLSGCRHLAALLCASAPFTLTAFLLAQGEEGLQDVLRILQDEFRLSMALAGKYFVCNGCYRSFCMQAL